MLHFPLGICIQNACFIFQTHRIFNLGFLCLRFLCDQDSRIRLSHHRIHDTYACVLVRLRFHKTESLSTIQGCIKLSSITTAPRSSINVGFAIPRFGSSNLVSCSSFHQVLINSDLVSTYLYLFSSFYIYFGFMGNRTLSPM